MRAKDFLKDNKDTWAGGGTEFEPNWNQEIGMDAGQGYQRASGNLPGGINLSLAADTPSQISTFSPQRGVNIAKGPASLYLGDQGSVSGSYNIPVGQDSSVSLNAAGQRDRGVQSYGLNYQKGGFNAGVSKGTHPGATPQVNVGYSAQFEEDSDVEEGKIISDKELVDVYLKGKHYDQIIQKKVAEGIPNRMVHAFIDKVAAKFGLNPSAFIYGPSRNNEVTEMAGSVHGGIRKVLKDKGYKYLGSGIDKQAWLEPSTGKVLIVFGYRKGHEKDFSPDQRMFIEWINYCNTHKNNRHLPRFSGFESFQFQGKNYIQARMEALTELPPNTRAVVHHIDSFADKIAAGVTGPSRFAVGDFDEVFDQLLQRSGYRNVETVIKNLGGRQRAEELLRTIHIVREFGKDHGYTVDLHARNYMQRADGTIVVNDPFVLWLGSSKG
jgi:hypothetical protein